MVQTSQLIIDIEDLQDTVSGVLQVPSDCEYLMLLAHGAGAGMQHTFMEQLSMTLIRHRIAVLRFNFLYMEKGKRRPDRTPRALAVLEAATAFASKLADKLEVPIVVAGKSFGGRMFSHLLASSPHPSVIALVFYGFPLHAAGKPGVTRAAHLGSVECPMLFLQGSRDKLATSELIEEVVSSLDNADLKVYDGADHGFHMLKRTGVSDSAIIDQLATDTASWLKKVSLSRN